MLWLIEYGPAVVNVLTIDTSSDAVAVPPLPVLSVLLPGTGSGSVADTVALLSKAPAAVMVAVTVMVVFAPEARLEIVQGSDPQAPLTVVMVRCVGGSATWMFVAVDGPALATTIVRVRLVAEACGAPVV